MKKNKDIYRGEVLIQTVIKDKRQEKHVYIKDTFIKDKTLHLDSKGATLALKYDLNTIDEFKKNGIISPEEAERLKEEITTLDAKVKAFQKWKKENPQTTKEEETKALKEIEKTNELKNHDFNLAIRKLITQKNTKEVLPLFKSINSTTHFGITKSIMDRLNHLPTLLDNAKAIQISGEQWEIKSDCSNKNMGPIGLCHSFTASDNVSAKKYLDDYKKWMREEGLKTLTAYWKIACERNKFCYSSSLSELMSKNSDDKRTSFFSVKEKQKFWANTRKLENTKLTIELHLPKKNLKKSQKIILEHRLVDVGARMQNINENTYPNNVMVNVLNSEQFQHQSQIATAIHNNTLKLPQKDVLLALTMQIRQAQTKNKDKNTFDEDFLINRANLQQTAKANKSKARSDLKKKLEKFKKSEIIEQYSVTEKRQKIYTIKPTPKKNT